MTQADTFLADLREAGIVLRASGDRLVVEAPAGLVTSQLRHELVRRKGELISVLRGSVEIRIDPLDNERVCDVAKLLAAGYRRYLKTAEAAVNQRRNTSSDGLAFRPASSVHEGGS